MLLDSLGVLNGVENWFRFTRCLSAGETAPRNIFTIHARFRRSVGVEVDIGQHQPARLRRH